MAAVALKIQATSLLRVDPDMSISTLDRAASLNRWRHRALGEKALIGLGFLALAVTLPPWPSSALVGLAVTAFALIGARVPLRLWVSTAAFPIGFLASGALMVLLQLSSEGLGISAIGADRALALCMRAMAATFCLMFLALTTPAAALIGGLRRLGVPAEIVELALLIYRFVFLLADEAMAMTQAQRARLGHATHRGRLRSTGMVIANLLPRAMARAGRLEKGLAARGWHSEMRVLSQRVPISHSMVALVLAVQCAIFLTGLLV